MPSSLSSHDVESELSDDSGDVAIPKDAGTTSWMAPAHESMYIMSATGINAVCNGSYAHSFHTVRGNVG